MPVLGSQLEGGQPGLGKDLIEGQEDVPDQVIRIQEKKFLT